MTTGSCIVWTTHRVKLLSIVILTLVERSYLNKSCEVTSMIDRIQPGNRSGFCVKVISSPENKLDIENRNMLTIEWFNFSAIYVSQFASSCFVRHLVEINGNYACIH